MGIALGLGVLAGVRAASGGSAMFLVPIAVIAVVLVLFCSAKPRVLLLVGLLGCMAGVGLGWLRHDPVAQTQPAFAGSQFEGRVMTDPRARGRGHSVEIGWVDDLGAAQQSLVFLPASADAGRGDSVRFAGEFSGTDATVIFASTMTRTGSAGNLEQFRRRLRAAIDRRIRRNVPGSAGSLALGLLIGDDSALTTAERDQVRQAGLSHVTAVSGWNVTVVVMTTALVLRALNLYQRRWFFLQIVAIAAFVWLVGIQPPILRAALMGVVGLTAFQIGRPAHLLTLLALAAAAMAGQNPAMLESLSFQLSVLSMVGIALAAPLVERLDGIKGIVGAAVLVPIAAAMMTAPLIAAQIGTFSLATVPANILAAPLVTYGGYAAALAALFADVPVLGTLVGTAVWLSCGAILKIAQLSTDLPGMYWTFRPLAPSTVVAVYIVLLATLSPLIPEGRLLLRSASTWLEQAPATAAVAGASVVAVLALMLVFV